MIVTKLNTNWNAISLLHLEVGQTELWSLFASCISPLLSNGAIRINMEVSDDKPDDKIHFLRQTEI